MKRFKLAIIAMFTLVMFSNVSAQDENNPWVIGLGINSVDVRDYSKDFGTNIEDYFGFEDTNTLPSISRISVDRYLNKGFSVQLAGTLNKVNTVVVKNDADAVYYSIDALLKYDLNNWFGETGWFDPYVGLGASFQDVSVAVNGRSGKSDFMVAGALGFNTWFSEKIGLNFQTGYKHNFNDSGYDIIQHSLGLVYRFGGKDSDGDGIYDKNDDCPDVPGVIEFNGCPDSDGDGIKDSEDACPNVAGLAALNGCPDADGDGIADKDDMCPNVAGTKANNGCPDTDGDGIVDKDDMCPTVAGPVDNKGCPWPDTDGDGVLDKNDNCVDVPGPASNNGCPVAKPLDLFEEVILFNTDKSSFKPGVTEILNNMIQKMNEFPTANFIIRGNTDSVGSAAYNVGLSNRRAKAVMNYFSDKGIDASRLTFVGLGETAPVDSNATRAGRANNRRVEVKSKN